MDTRTVIVVGIIAVVVSNIWVVRTKLPHLSRRQKTVASVAGLVVIAGLTAAYFTE
jgi:hypothetical protein